MIVHRLLYVYDCSQIIICLWLFTNYDMCMIVHKLLYVYDYSQIMISLWLFTNDDMFMVIHKLWLFHCYYNYMTIHTFSSYWFDLFLIWLKFLKCVGCTTLTTFMSDWSIHIGNFKGLNTHHDEGHL